MAGPTSQTRELVTLVKGFCFPGGDDAVRAVRRITSTQRGDIRASPAAKWNPFTAVEYVDATTTAFCWEARMGGNIITSVQVTDAYENGHGRLVVKKGPIQLTRLVGPEVDRGELQRYLAYVIYCPAILANNPSLDIQAIGPLTLRLRDRGNHADACVDVDFSDEGQPLVVRAVRPMAIGRRTVLTPWSASAHDYEVVEGIRTPRRMEASWTPPEGHFTYVRMDVTSLEILR